jgi:tetratricopeptide (TPR) repeat protein
MKTIQYLTNQTANRQLKSTTRIIVLTCCCLALFSVKSYSQTAEEWKKSGNVFLDSTNYDRAIEHYEKAIEVDSNYFDAYFNLGIAYSGKMDYDKSIEYYNKALSLKDTVADTYFVLGELYNEKQDYDSAIKIIKKGLSFKPDSPDQYYFLGYLYQQKGNQIYPFTYIRKAAQLGDSIAQHYFLDNDFPWDDPFIKPDYEQIKNDIENKRSDFYYDKLMKRYQQGDSTMTLSDKQHLYYGYVFNKNYSPYLTFPNQKEINKILNKEDEISKEEWETLLSLTDAALKIEPFSLRNLHYQSLAYKYLNKTTEADVNYRKIVCILDALQSTGDAYTKETAIHVISVASEYDYLFVNNLSMQSQALINGGFDVLYLQSNTEGIEEAWFDVNQSLNSLRK